MPFLSKINKKWLILHSLELHISPPDIFCYALWPVQPSHRLIGPLYSNVQSVYDFITIILRRASHTVIILCINIFPFDFLSSSSPLSLFFFSSSIGMGISVWPWAVIEIPMRGALRTAFEAADLAHAHVCPHRKHKDGGLHVLTNLDSLI